MVSFFDFGAFPQVSGASRLDIHSKQKALKSDGKPTAERARHLEDCTVGGRTALVLKNLQILVSGDLSS